MAQQCEKRFLAEPEGPMALSWLRALFRLDADRATDALDTILRAECARTQQCEYSPGCLGSGRTASSSSATKGRVHALGRFVHSIVQRVRPDDDQHHDGVFGAGQTAMPTEAPAGVPLPAPGYSRCRDWRVVRELAEDQCSHFPERLSCSRARGRGRESLHSARARSLSLIDGTSFRQAIAIPFSQ